MWPVCGVEDQVRDQQVFGVTRLRIQRRRPLPNTATLLGNLVALVLCVVEQEVEDRNEDAASGKAREDPPNGKQAMSVMSKVQHAAPTSARAKTGPG